MVSAYSRTHPEFFSLKVLRNWAAEGTVDLFLHKEERKEGMVWSEERIRVRLGG